MGSELQTKYQRLAQEYAKLRAQVDVLKKGVVGEKTRRTALEEELRQREQALRKHVQENESLGFRNQQLSKRVTLLQDELDSPSGKSKKRHNKDTHPGISLTSDVQTEELAAKITENEKLHTKIFEVTQKSERLVAQLKEKIANLEQEVADNDTLLSELNKEHSSTIGTLEEHRTMLQAKLEKVNHEFMEARQLYATYGSPVQEQKNGLNNTETPIFHDSNRNEYNMYNIANMDRSTSSKLDSALHAAVNMMEKFFTHLTTMFTYLEQRSNVYPVDTSTGLLLSPVNQKLCEMLRGSTLYTNRLLSVLQSFSSNPETSWMVGTAELSEVGYSLENFSKFLETTSSYIQLSIHTESEESICGAQLTETNSEFSLSFNIISGIVSSISEYINTLAEVDNNTSVQDAILHKLHSSCTDLHETLVGLSNQFNSKVTQEYQLPTSSQKLKTANECTISAITSLCSASQEFSDFFDVYGQILLASLSQDSKPTSGKSNSVSTVTKLRQQAVHYCENMLREPPPQVPYSLAIHLSQQFVGNSENKDVLQQQVLSLQDRLSKIQQEKEQLAFDYQLLVVKYEKAQKKVTQLKESGNNTVFVSENAISSKDTPVLQGDDDTDHIREPMLGTLTSQELLVEAEDDVSTEILIRQHFGTRLAELNFQLQEAESKAAFLHSQCGALTKQLTHSNATKKSLSHDLQSAQESIQQLQDQLVTLSSGYESQLSTMSDHLCELRDKLLKKEEEMEMMKKGGKKKWNK